MRTGLSRRHRGWAGLALAAGIGAFAVLWGMGGNAFNVPGVFFLQRVATEPGESRRLALKDGTAVSVSGDSLLWIRLLPGTRAVSLSAGEAYFNVAKDANRPFIVRAGETRVTAVGTAFNVRHAGGRVVVAVSESVVNVVQPVAESGESAAAPGVSSTARLVAGQEVRVERAKPMPLPVAVELQAVGGWCDGRLQYLDEPLRNIVADIRRYSARDMVIVDPALGDLCITGTVFENNLEAWLAPATRSASCRFPRLARLPPRAGTESKGSGAGTHAVPLAAGRDPRRCRKRLGYLVKGGASVCGQPGTSPARSVPAPSLP